jgi:hypothetical protein
MSVESVSISYTALGTVCPVSGEILSKWRSLGRRMLAGGLQLKGRFIKEHGAAGLTGQQFSEILSLIDEGIPVAVGRDHSMAMVGYRRDDSQPGGGIAFFRNSYGTTRPRALNVSVKLFWMFTPTASMTGR